MNALKKYEKEIGVSLTIESLIDSHRRLRNYSKRTNKELREEREKAYESGVKAGHAHAVTHDYISRERLRSMTLAELSELLGEDV